MSRFPYITHTASLVRTIALAASLAVAACADADETTVGASTGAVPAPSAGTPGATNASATATTGNVDQDFLRAMSDRHQGIVAIARPTKGRFGAGEAVRGDAATLDAKGTAQLDSMSAMLRSAFNDQYLAKVLPNHQAVSDSLAKLSGPAFDRHFYDGVIAHHQEGIRMLEQYIPRLTRPDLKAMAERMRDEHRREIEELERKRDVIK
jgi:uncharacterized protein (DUF305 family)